MNAGGGHPPSKETLTKTGRPPSTGTRSRGIPTAAHLAPEGCSLMSLESVSPEPPGFNFRVNKPRRICSHSGELNLPRWRSPGVIDDSGAGKKTSGEPAGGKLGARKGAQKRRRWRDPQARKGKAGVEGGRPGCLSEEP